MKKLLLSFITATLLSSMSAGSAGVLTDEGARLLLDHVDKIKHLKFINMKYNYLSDEMKNV
jgi:predicted peroxiredoxin